MVKINTKTKKDMLCSFYEKEQSFFTRLVSVELHNEKKYSGVLIGFNPLTESIIILEDGNKKRFVRSCFIASIKEL